MGGFGGKTIFWRELWNSVFRCVQAWKRMETYKSGHSEHFHFCAKIMLFVTMPRMKKNMFDRSMPRVKKNMFDCTMPRVKKNMFDRTMPRVKKNMLDCTMPRVKKT
jgi:hypothetical protein